MAMEITLFDNKLKKVGDDLKKNLSGASLYVCATIFSIYGYEVLKKEFNRINDLKFIFTSSAFIEEKQNKKVRKIFVINNIKKSISGTEFEISLKNKLKNSFIAKECKNWIQKKVRFKALKGNFSIDSMFIVENSENKIMYVGLDEFSSTGFGYKKDNSLIKTITKISNNELVNQQKEQFNQVWNNEYHVEDITGKVIDYISTLYKENSPEFIYYLILYHIFNEFLEDLNEDELANEKTGFKNSIIWQSLYDFQKDAALGIINRLEKFNGCILADSVGLGKTYTALAVIKYYQERNKSILVLCPKKLGDNWKTFLNNYIDNPFVEDRFNYDVLYHTDLLRERGYSNGIDLSRVNWSNYDLIVIDESHNFRNNNMGTDKKTRYQKLLEDVIKKGVKTKVLMLSATPVNNRFNDLKNQLALAYEGQTNILDERLGTSKSIDVILRNAQKVFNEWMKLPETLRTSKELLKRLSSHLDFFKLLDAVTIARSRKHIERYYDISKIGKFPKRLKPKTLQPPITSLPDFMSIKDLYLLLSKLNLAYYSPFDYLLPSKRKIYEERYDNKISDNVYLRQRNREKSLKILMRINLLKRLESSVYSFQLTLKRFIEKIEKLLEKIENFQKLKKSGGNLEIEFDEMEDEDRFIFGDKVQINLDDIDILTWYEDLRHDLSVAKKIYNEMLKIDPNNDQKLQELKKVIVEKLENPINPGNKKILIFTAFADTADYLYKNLKEFNLAFGLHTAKVVGSDSNETTLPIHKDFNNLLVHFAPKAKSVEEIDNEIDVLIATDCISEGQNLQDCDFLINYDIHWNPVRIIQRFGRIDRIGSHNEQIQMVNFWPQLSLDEYIKLKRRVEAKMHMVDTAATGEDNPLTNESSDLMFRKKQLERLQNEVIDLEDIDSTVSITDLGLNDFRMDLIEYLKQKGSLEDTSTGLHTVILEDKERELEEGVIFVLKNIHESVNIDKTNQLHPFYLVYIKKSGEVHYTHLEAKSILDLIRSFSRGKQNPIKEAYEKFNEETKDGENMEKYSLILNKAIESILNVKEETAIESLFSKGGTVIDKNEIKGLDDFELIAFIIIIGKNAL